MTFPKMLWPSVTALSLAFTVGAWIGHATEARAQYVPLLEYQSHVVAEQIRAIKDSARMDVLLQQNARIERMQRRVNCKLLKECDE